MLLQGAVTWRTAVAAGGTEVKPQAESVLHDTDEMNSFSQFRYSGKLSESFIDCGESAGGEKKRLRPRKHITMQIVNKNNKSLYLLGRNNPSEMAEKTEKEKGKLRIFKIFWNFVPKNRVHTA